MPKVNITISVEVDTEVLPMEVVLEELASNSDVYLMKGAVMVLPPEIVLVDNPQLENVEEADPVAVV